MLEGRQIYGRLKEDCRALCAKTVLAVALILTFRVYIYVYISIYTYMEYIYIHIYILRKYKRSRESYLSNVIYIR